MLHLVLKLQKPQNLAPPVGTVIPVAGMDLFRKFQIAVSGQRRKQIETLENEPDLSTANIGPLCIGHFRQVLAVDMDRTGRRRKESAEQVKQGRFSAT